VWDVRVKPRIGRLIAQTISAWPDRQKHQRANSFELLGFDILLDSELNPWLLEINADPGLHMLTDVVNVHHRRAVEDMMTVLLDRRQEWLEAPSTSPDSAAQHRLTIGVWELVLKR